MTARKEEREGGRERGREGEAPTEHGQGLVAVAPPFARTRRLQEREVRRLREGEREGGREERREGGREERGQKGRIR
jgi:hypothetical protein